MTMFSSRVPFKKKHWESDRSYTITERPQHNPTNPILADLRDYWMFQSARPTAWHAARYLEIVGFDGYASEEIAHARCVLTRLANFEKGQS